MKLLWITKEPSSNKTDFFNELGKRVRLTVLYEKRMNKSTYYEWNKNSCQNYYGVILETKCKRGRYIISKDKEDKLISRSNIFHEYIKIREYIKYSRYDLIVLEDQLNLREKYMGKKLSSLNIPYILSGNITKKEKEMKQLIDFNIKIIKNARGYIGTSNEIISNYTSYGMDENKITIIEGKEKTIHEIVDSFYNGIHRYIN